MKTMKKLFAALLALCLLTVLAACNSEKEAEIPKTLPKEETVKLEIDYDNLVTDAHSQTIGAGVYSIPQINCDTDDCKEINAKIWETLYDGVVATITPDYPLVEGDGIFYKWTVHDDVLSLLIESTSMDISWTDYYVYNVDLTDGTLMTNAEVLSKADLTFSEYETKIQLAVETQFYENMAATDASSIDATYINTFNTCLQKSKDTANIDETTAYFNEEGQLCTVIKIYSMAGAEYYWNILNLSDDATGFETTAAVVEPAAAQEAAEGESVVEENTPTEAATEAPEEQAPAETTDNPEVVDHPEEVPAVSSEAEIPAEEATQTPQ